MRLLLIMLLCSCIEQDEQWHENVNSKLIYVKDARTNLCFASMYVGHGGVLTLVPCTPEVEKLIKPAKPDKTECRTEGAK